ncbi:Single-stranded-DNA-specific exonuclease RecJ [hydrothermal vent metagenome]|uniref:Single-stranded-DNA-specific exonuclease RecJ n=1 Tax=hydrothermal vent metagenome TaxID=652676 RepID=A0A3B0UHQ5_9ZZZZ
MTATPAEIALGVERSLAGRCWRYRPHDPDIAARIGATLDMPELVARLIAARHDIPATVSGFLTPTLRDALPDPSTLAGMDAAASRIADAAMAEEPVAVFADYDVDGATAAALLVRYFSALGQRVRTYVPDRVTEGYGPNTAALAELADAGAGLIVCVDCGIAAHEVLEAHGRAYPDIAVVILDHHQATEHLPAAHAVVNPNRLDDISGLGTLAAVGVTFLTLVAVNREMRRRGHFGAGAEPDLLALLGLVALGTVADVVPLTGLNRAFVTQGLRVLARGGNPGLTALARVARMNGPPAVTQLGFQLGPRLNAGGRIGRADLGLRLLTTADADEADALAAELERLNRERKSIEAAALAQALEDAEAGLAARDSDGNDIVVVAGRGWHPGIVGLVAARLKDRFRRPAVAIAIGEDGVARGSARSMPGVDIGAAIRAACDAGIITKGGGHAMAAGLSMEGTVAVTPDQVATLREFLNHHAGAAAATALAQDRLSIDAPLAAGGVNEALMGWLDRIGPFGAGMPEPRFVFPAHTVSYAARAGDNHIRLSLKDGSGNKLDAMAFRQLTTPLGQALLATGGAPLHIAGKLVRDNWGGRAKVKLFVDDAAPARV